MKNLKILMIGNNLGIQSGVQRYIQNLLLHLDLQRDTVDLLAAACPPGQEDTRPALAAAGVRQFILLPDSDKQRLPGLAKYLLAHKHEYDIVHFHTASKANALACVLIRLICPKVILIVHSHIVYPPVTLSWRAAHLLYQITATYFLACGVAAGRFVFGPKIDRKQNFKVACNAVDSHRFYPDAQKGAAVRAQYGITEGQKLAGFVGRYNHQKNLTGLLHIFAELHRQDASWQLLLVGSGEDQSLVNRTIAALSLTECVHQAGVQSEISAFMNAFDVFLLPSEFEGSPITLVEAQGCGVPCVASTNVPADGAVTDLVQFLPLDAPLLTWARTIQQAANAPGAHTNHWAELSAAGYELSAAAERMQDIYDCLAAGR